MKMFKRLTAMALAAMMVIGCANFAGAESTAKYTTETTKDGWIKVTQEGGETLGYSPDSGVTLIEQDGFAFKDLNKNGVLDVYEDWRLTDEERIDDVVARLSPQQMVGLRFHIICGALGVDGASTRVGPSRGPAVTELTGEYAVESLFTRCLQTNISGTVAAHVQWNNNMQAIAEKAEFGVPILFSSDARQQYTGGMSNLALAATFNPELAAEDSKGAAKNYRAMGFRLLLGPQGDLTTEPRWNRINGAFGEDPALSRDMSAATFNAYQSTYDENGNDLGWGKDSILTMMKHWPGDGSAENGRESHNAYGAYTVYPGNAFITGLIPYVDGAMKLDGATQSASSVMLSYSIAYSEDGAYGDLVCSALSQYKIQLLHEYGFEGVISTDALMRNMVRGVSAELSNEEIASMMFIAGVDRAMWWDLIDTAPESYDQIYTLMVEELGEEGALENCRAASTRILREYAKVDLFDNPYAETTAAVTLIDNSGLTAAVNANAEASIVMLKNNETILNRTADEEKLTVYVPYKYANGAWTLPVSLKSLYSYFNVVTDTVGEPTGENDAQGKATYTENDIVRATSEELASCDMAIAFIASPNTGVGYLTDTAEYVPISLQYGKYQATSASVREVSLAGDTTVINVQSPYGAIEQYEKEDRSYFAKSTVATNLSDLELVQYLAKTVPESCKVIACISADRPMIFSEFEADVDAILVDFGVADENFLPLLAGKVEPSALLPIQMPVNMETVEAQCEDVPRDMECYVDANGNTYDFAFGMNWSGVINDERVQKYSVPALTEPATQPVQ